MIRTNLATRPFYNERAVSLWLLACLFAVVAATVFNTTRVLRYSQSDTELGTSASQDESRASELRASAAKLRNSVDAKQIERASGEARQANDLIDRRTFSWTELFNVFEKTLPDDVRITAVRPKVDRGQFALTISVVARGVEDLNAFMNGLEATGAFLKVGSGIEERVNDQGQIQASVEAVYKPSTGRAAGRGARTTGVGRP
jgi:Tfp pilus assembly protein PilN